MRSIFNCFFFFFIKPLNVDSGETETKVTRSTEEVKEKVGAPSAVTRVSLGVTGIDWITNE